VVRAGLLGTGGSGTRCNCLLDLCHCHPSSPGFLHLLLQVVAVPLLLLPRVVVHNRIPRAAQEHFVGTVAVGLTTSDWSGRGFDFESGAIGGAASLGEAEPLDARAIMAKS
jgi:hypothetical protein